jgi:hypothetical protein
MNKVEGKSNEVINNGPLWERKTLIIKIQRV